MKRAYAILVLAALTCAWGAGCRFGEKPESAALRRPRPVLSLAGQSYAYRVSNPSALPTGPGAEGRSGDLLLENAFVRFVVAAADHRVSGKGGGHLIDATVQGGEDRMRMLLPMVGGDPLLPPVYERVRVAQGGGLELPAGVVAEGHVSGHPDLKVTTNYVLAPASRVLEIETAVENAGQRDWRGFATSDLLYHGRTLRYEPASGLCPTQREADVPWMAFSYADRCWGLLPQADTTMAVRHDVGVTDVRYASLDLPAGGKTSIRRRLMAALGGPEAVWLETYGPASDDIAVLRVRTETERRHAAIANCIVDIMPREIGSPLMAWTDAAGWVELRLPTGSYDVLARAAGRPPVGPVRVEVESGLTHELTIRPGRPCEARVQVRGTCGEFLVPCCARLTAAPLGGATPPTGAGPAFPTQGLAGPVLTDGRERGTLFLDPLADGLASPYMVVGSRGPLLGLMGTAVAAEKGREFRVNLTLRQRIDTGAYVAVDLRQYTDASLHSSLTVAERVRANACEGLAGAVVSDAVFRGAFVNVQDQQDSVLVPGLSVDVPGVGAFSAFPVACVGPTAPDLAELYRPGVTASQVIAFLRERLGGAIVQVDDPMNPRTGHFALAGFDPLRDVGEPEALCSDFDALEVLSGSRTDAADRVLSSWFHLLNQGRRPFVTGGSGSRGIVGDVAGIARTYVHCPCASGRPTERELTAAMRSLKDNPNAFVSNGPFLDVTLNGKPIGSTQNVGAGKARMRLKVSAPLWMDVADVTVFRNGQPVAEFELESGGVPMRCDRTLELGVDGDCWFVVCVRGNSPMSALYGATGSAPTPWAATNPFWVDADGDGEVRPAM